MEVIVQEWIGKAKIAMVAVFAAMMLILARSSWLDDVSLLQSFYYSFGSDLSTAAASQLSLGRANFQMALEEREHPLPAINRLFLAVIGSLRGKETMPCPVVAIELVFLTLLT